MQFKSSPHFEFSHDVVLSLAKGSDQTSQSSAPLLELVVESKGYHPNLPTKQYQHENHSTLLFLELFN